MFRLSTLQNYGTRVCSRASSSFTQADLPPCDFKPAKYTGPAADKITEIRKKHLHPAIFTYYKQPILISQGHMQYLFDEKGQRYVDCLGGIVTISVGHCHPKVVAALGDQAQKLWHTSTIYNYAPLMTYIEKLTSKFPDPLKVVYLVNSGSEANDLALLMSRMYTNSQDVVSLRNAYHGISPTVMPLSAMQTWRHKTVLPGGHHHAMLPDPYRGPWGGKNCRNSPSQAKRDCDCKEGECKACDSYIDEFEDLLRSTTTKNSMACFIAESIQGAGGTYQFPKNYLKRAYELVRARNGLCIADEVQTGFGRTGEKYWGWETHDVVPDIVTMAKGIGNGFPFAAVVTRREIAETLTHALHFNTFGGNPMGCAVASTVLDVIDEEKLQANSKTVGTHILNRLMALQKKHSCLGDVRGLGLMLAVELVSDPVKKTPVSVEVSNGLMEKMKEKYILFGKSGVFGNIVRFKPPMCFTIADADYVVDALDASLTEMGL